MNEIKEWLDKHGISEVECIVPDMAGTPRGKIMPAAKFAEEQGMLEEDPREQAAIALIHEFREEGLSLRAIDKELRKRGFRSRGGKRWHVQTLANILRATESVAVAG